MISFFISLAALIAGYYFYGRIAERIFKIDPDRKTPALTMNDGVDYIPMPMWKIFMIQFLNIAGLGPIFGAIAGAMWGPAAFLWIVLGSIFAGAVHDYFSGMLSIKHKGLSISEVVGIYLGNSMRVFMMVFTVILMIMVGTVFIMGPARILAEITSAFAGYHVWVWVVFIYYIIATLLPIDKIIGRLYPLFGISLLFMAIGLMGAIFFKGYHIPELNLQAFRNMHDNAGSFPVFPMLFITIACGAISGFHSTQSPLMARCVTNEKQGKPVFYGAMITEGIVALIWAAISMTFFGGVRELNEVMLSNHSNAALIVNQVSNSLLGKVGGILAILGVVAAPITSGDTAFRSARLIVADFIKLNQGPGRNRLLISLPLFVIGFLLTQINFGIVWRYFAWSNQTLATVVLWAITVYLAKERKFYWLTLVPASFMTVVVISYLMFAGEGFGLPYSWSISGGLAVAVALLTAFRIYLNRLKEERLILEA